jgi:hypothetical protein
MQSIAEHVTVPPHSCALACGTVVDETVHIGQDVLRDGGRISPRAPGRGGGGRHAESASSAWLSVAERTMRRSAPLGIGPMDAVTSVAPAVPNASSSPCGVSDISVRSRHGILTGLNVKLQLESMLSVLSSSARMEPFC